MNDTLAYARSCEENRSLADRILARGDVFILSGYRCGMKVCNGALHIQQGSTNGEEHDPILQYRGTTEIRQIIITSSSGNISLDALYWCKDQGISLLMLDGHGDLVYSIIPDNRNAASLRRAQYLTGSSVRIAQEIVHRKTVSQYDTVQKHYELRKRDALLRILEQGEWELSHTNFASVDYLRSFEGGLASAYFDAFIGIPLNWQKSDGKKIPPHWKHITDRASPLSSNARHAVCPFHAALNYLYTVAEHQLLVAMHSAGLDPACGLLHVDKSNRLSLVYDLIEPVRAQVDDQALTFFANTVLKRGDLVPLRNGQVLFNTDFARYMVASCKIESDVSFDIVSWFKGLLVG